MAGSSARAHRLPSTNIDLLEVGVDAIYGGLTENCLKGKSRWFGEELCHNFLPWTALSLPIDFLGCLRAEVDIYLN